MKKIIISISLCVMLLAFAALTMPVTVTAAPGIGPSITLPACALEAQAPCVMAAVLYAGHYNYNYALIRKDFYDAKNYQAETQALASGIGGPLKFPCVSA